jgi:hypothetical protein
MHELPVQACGTGSVCTVQWIYTKAKISVLQKCVTNVDIYSNVVLHRTIFRFYVEGEFRTVYKLLNWRTNKCGGSVSVYIVLNALDSDARKPVININSSWTEETCLVELNSLDHQQP